MTRLYVKRRRAENEAARAKEAERHARQVARYAALPDEKKAAQRPPRDAPKPLPWQGLRVLEALAASGLRSVRYWKEIPDREDDLDFVTVNDLEEAAVESIRRNVLHNGLDPERVRPNIGDATMVMHASRAASFGRPYDVVDLDPYGTAAPFIDSAVQAVNGNGGLLAVTCTDKSVLCGNNPEVCLAKYGSVGLRGPFCHEMGLRMLLSTLAKAAARHGRYIVPVASLSIDFYVRVFVRVYTGANEVKLTSSRLSTVYQCVGCGSFALQPLGQVVVNGRSVKHSAGRGPPVGAECEQCGSGHRVGGPVWNGPLHDPQWLADAMAEAEAEPERYATAPRIRAMLGTAAAELPDVPLLYGFSHVAKALRTTQPTLVAFKSALLNAGYRVSGSHTDPVAIKTDAPPSAVFDVMRCYVRDVAPPKKPSEPDSLAARIMARQPAFTADFTRRDEAKPSKGPRFLPNPEENWGPKARAGGLAARAAKPGADAPALTVEQRMALKRSNNQGRRKAKRQRRKEEAEEEREGADEEEGEAGDGDAAA